MKISNLLSLDASQLRHLGVVAPVMLAVAVAATCAAGYAGKQLAQAAGARAASVRLVQAPAAAQDLERVAERLTALSPDVQASVQGQALRVVAKEGAFPAWVHSLASLPGLDGQLVWRTQRLCVADCGGPDYVAEVVAARQALQVGAPPAAAGAVSGVRK